MSRRSCSDCGTLLERNGICQNCDEAAYITEYQAEYMDPPSEQFQKEANEGYQRAKKRNENPEER